MNRIKFTLLFLLISISSIAQVIEDISFGTDVTLEVVTWNIERFPKNNQTTIDQVARVIKAIDADVYAVQEIDDILSFNSLMASLPEYDSYITSDKFRGLAYIYKKSTITVNSAYEIYNSNTFWSPFPRYPMVLDFNFKNERYVIINNHLKCCGDGILNTTNTSDEENRRLNATRLLKEYMDDNLSDVNVFLVGDFNDHIHDVRAHNVFQEFIDDSEDYVFADMDIANGTNTNWSFPSWPSHLDHILITNELFDEFQLNTTVVETIKVDDYVGGWNNYDTNITDHRPVAIKFTPSATLSIDNLTLNSIEFKSYPNPISNQTTFSIKNVSGVKSLRILDVLGREVFKSSAIKDKNYVWNRTSLPSGMYFANLYANNQLVKTIKVLLE